MSIFLRFKHGTRIEIEANIFENIHTFLNEFRPDRDPREILKCLIIREHWGPHPDSTWFAVLDDYFRLYDYTPGKYLPALRSAQLNFLTTLATQATPEELWPHVKPTLLRDFDLLSGWEFSRAKQFSEFSRVWQDKDGKYYTEHEGEQYLVYGARSLAETKFEYLENESGRKYGIIHQTCRLISLCNIFLSYRLEPDKYPKSVRVVIPDDCSLDYHWYWLIPVRSPRVRWLPPSQYCDPHFLVADLLGAYADTDPMPELPAAPPEGDVDDGFPWQLEACVDTDLRMGSEEEVVLKFRDRQVRWVNGTRSNFPTLIVGVQDKADYQAAEKRFCGLRNSRCCHSERSEESRSDGRFSFQP